MNCLIEDYLKRNNITDETFGRLGNLGYILNREEINTLIAKYGVDKDTVDAFVSIADILGYDREFRDVPSNIFQSLSYYFDNNGSTYQTRSIGLLEYDSDEILEKLQNSFYSEPIFVEELEYNKFAISVNGLHRYSVLRTLYLMEYSKISDDVEAVQKLNEKYTIPVKLSKKDYLKTYSKFFLQEDPSIDRIRDEFAPVTLRRTDKMEILYLDGSRECLNDTELLSKARKVALQSLQDPLYYEGIVHYASKYPSFYQFVNNNIYDLQLNDEITPSKVEGL